MATWLLIEPLWLRTRYLLLPLATFAVSLGASAGAGLRDLRDHVLGSRLTQGAVFIVLLYSLLSCRNAVYAIRYLVTSDSRAELYERVHREDRYDVAVWLNAHRLPGERLALYGYRGYRYFLDAEALLSSESSKELQWLGDHGPLHSPSSWTADLWRFYSEIWLCT